VTAPVSPQHIQPTSGTARLIASQRGGQRCQQRSHTVPGFHHQQSQPHPSSPYAAVSQTVATMGTPPDRVLLRHSKIDLSRHHPRKSLHNNAIPSSVYILRLPANHSYHLCVANHTWPRKTDRNLSRTNEASTSEVSRTTTNHRTSEEK
jgi:hypothetical protein